ncbi:MAG: DUF429 domain-containing protein [Halovenus sp.]
MGTSIGVHRVPTGWFGVVLRDGGSWETDFFPSIWSLWKSHSDASRIVVDVPVGLPSVRRRACDVEAKRKLSRQGRRVFYAPTRQAVYEGNLDEAKAINENAGYSIQNQVWSIVPRIREVDEFLDMNPGARDRLFETHPELCFYSLNGQATVPAGTTAEGIDRRKALVADEHPDAPAIYEAACDRYLTPAYASFLRAEGAILDALVAAVTAQRPTSELSRLPDGDDPPRDERGLPMQMVYPGDINQTRLTTIDEARQE